MASTFPSFSKFGAALALDEFVAAMTSNGAAVRSMVPGLQGWGTDERTGDVVLKVFASGTDRAKAEGQRDAIAALLGTLGTSGG